MSRRVYLLGVGLALVALALAFTDWALSLRPGATEANARRVQAGMTQDEVIALLGKPHKGAPPLPPEEGKEGDDAVGIPWIWESPDGSILVVFNGKGLVTWGAIWTPSDSPPGFLARLRAWLGW